MCVCVCGGGGGGGGGHLLSLPDASYGLDKFGRDVGGSFDVVVGIIEQFM